MYKVSDLLGKPLLSLSEAQMLGTISNIYFDAKAQKGTFAVFFDGEEEIRYIPLSKLINISSDAAVTVSSEGVTDYAAGLPSPINSAAFDQDGKMLGTVKDVIMDGAKVISYLTDNGSLNPGKIISAGKVLIFNTTGKAIKIRTAQKKEKPKDESEHKKEVELPTKSAFAPSYDFLLGKKLQRSISAATGKIIAHEGENVTSEIIEDAKKEGKLVILALNSL